MSDSVTGAGEVGAVAAVTGFLERSAPGQYKVSSIQDATRFSVRMGPHSALIDVFTTGAMRPGGAQNPVKAMLAQFVSDYKGGEYTPTGVPHCIDTLPDELFKLIPKICPTVLRLFTEARDAHKHGLNMSACFMLGAASERLILHLMESYRNNIGDPAHQASFDTRFNNRMVSNKWKTFLESYKSCHSKPTDGWANDLETVLNMTFEFCRITRNNIGHPEVLSVPVQGAIYVNLGYFLTYASTVYKLMEHFNANGVKVS